MDWTQLSIGKGSTLQARFRWNLVSPGKGRVLDLSCWLQSGNRRSGVRMGGSVKMDSPGLIARKDTVEAMMALGSVSGSTLNLL